MAHNADKTQDDVISSDESDHTINTDDTFSSGTENDSDLDDFIEYDMDYSTRSKTPCIQNQPARKMLESMTPEQLQDYKTEIQDRQKTRFKEIIDKYEENNDDKCT